MKRTVTFEPVEHRYFDEHKREYLAVSKLLQRLGEFDRQAVAAKVSMDPRSRYHGMTVEAIHGEWEKRRDDGHALHAAIQRWAESLEYPAPDSPAFSAVNTIASGSWKGTLRSEVILHSTVLHIAGTADWLDETKDGIDLWDFKTYRKLDDDKVKKCSLQLALYKLMLEEMQELPVTVRGVIWFENWTENPNVHPQIIQPIDCRKEYLQLVMERMAEANDEKEDEIERLMGAKSTAPLITPYLEYRH